VTVVASFSTSIPEACGHAALYFDPHSIGGLSNRILKITHNADLYSSLVKEGYRQYQRCQHFQEYQQPKMFQEIFE
jgi:hypothetical protein